MPNINLLPWRDERRKEQQQEFFTVLGGVAVAGIVVVALTYGAINLAIGHQQDRNQFIQTHIIDLEKQVKEIKNLKQRRAELLERMKIIQNLQGTRPVIVRVFDELVRTLPDGVFFEKVELKGRKMLIQGTAESNNRVSSLMRRLSKSEWFTEPNLTEVKANLDYGEQASDFMMSVKLVLPGVDEENQAAKKKSKKKKAKKRK